MNCGLKLVVRDAPGMCVNVSVQSDLLKHWQKVIKADYNLILVQPGTLPQVWLIEHSLFSRTSKKCLALVAATGVKLSRHVDCICTPPPLTSCSQEKLEIIILPRNLEPLMYRTALRSRIIHSLCSGETMSSGFVCARARPTPAGSTLDKRGDFWH